MLNGARVPDSLANLKARVAFAKVDVFVAAGMSGSARATLTALAAQFAGNPRVSAPIKDRLAKLR